MSLSWSEAWRGTAAGALLLAWAVAAHLGSAGVGSADLNAAVATTPLLLAWAVLLWQFKQRWVRLSGMALALSAVLALWPQLRQNIALLYYLQHLGTHLALAVLFGRTLLGPGEPLITRMARSIYGHALSERKVRYTRQVTLAWTLFFLGNAMVSTGLFLWAAPAVWSVHANLLTGPLIAGMFLAEHLVRQRVLPAHERPGLADVIRAYRRRAALGNAVDQPPESGA